MRVVPEQVQVLIVDTSGSNHAQLHTKLKAMRFSQVAVHDNLDESKTASMHFAGPTLVVMFLGGGATLTNFVRFFKRAAGKPIEIAFVAPVNAGDSVQKTFHDLGAAGFLRTDNSFDAIKLVERVMADSSRFAADEITTSTVDLFRKAPIGGDPEGDARPVSPVLESASTRTSRVPSLESVETAAVVRDPSNPGVRRRAIDSDPPSRRESQRSASSSSEDSFVRRSAARVQADEVTGTFPAVGSGFGMPSSMPPPKRPSGVGPAVAVAAPSPAQPFTPPPSPPSSPSSPSIAAFDPTAAKRPLPMPLILGGSAALGVIVIVVAIIFIVSGPSSPEPEASSPNPAPGTPAADVARSTSVTPASTPLFSTPTPTPIPTPLFAVATQTPSDRVLSSMPAAPAPTPFPTPGPFAAATPTLAIPTSSGANDPFGSAAPRPSMPFSPSGTPVPVSPFTSTPASASIVEVRSTPVPTPQLATPDPATPMAIGELRRIYGGQRAPGVTATVEGIVTFGEGGFVPHRNQFTLQDETGGLLVDDQKGLGGKGLREGDRVRVTGEVGEFRGMLQLAMSRAPEVLPGGGAIAPRAVEPRQFGEDLEGQLVRLEDVRLHGSVLPTSARNANITLIDKAGNEFNVFIDEDIGVFGVGPPSWFTVQGILFQWGPNDLPSSYVWVVYPRGWEDFIAP